MVDAQSSPAGSEDEQNYSIHQEVAALGTNTGELTRELALFDEFYLYKEYHSMEKNPTMEGFAMYKQFLKLRGSPAQTATGVDTPLAVQPTDSTADAILPPTFSESPLAAPIVTPTISHEPTTPWTVVTPEKRKPSPKDGNRFAPLADADDNADLSTALALLASHGYSVTPGIESVLPRTLSKTPTANGVIMSMADRIKQYGKTFEVVFPLTTGKRKVKAFLTTLYTHYSTPEWMMDDKRIVDWDETTP